MVSGKKGIILMFIADFSIMREKKITGFSTFRVNYASVGSTTKLVSGRVILVIYVLRVLCHQLRVGCNSFFTYFHIIFLIPRNLKVN
jgi:hypothetical protein